jgi:hypothetical protein
MRGPASLSVVRAAKDYLELGIEPVPVQARDKAAVHDWKTAPPVTAENVVSRFREGQNIGARLGRRSLGLVDIDLDCDEAIKLAQSFLPSTGRIFGRATSQRAHWLYRSDLHESEDAAALQYKHPVTKEVLIELRIGSDGHDAMTVMPPSIHKGTGENIVWYEEGEITWVDGAILKQAVIKIAVGCLILRCYPDEGGRHDFWLTIDGYLSRVGWSKNERKGFIEIAAIAAGDDEIKDRVRVGDWTEKKQKVPGLPSLRKLLGKEVADKIDEWLRRDRRADPFPDDGRPIIEIKQGTLRQQVDAAEEALVNCVDTPIYLQAGRLVQPLVEEADAARGRKTTVARISPLISSSLRYQLSRAAKWGRWNSRSNSLSAIDPPRDVAETLLAHGSWKLLKELVGIIETPTLRPDFSVLSEPGYDPATGLLLVNSPPMPKIPEEPSRADAENARRLLNTLLDEFPFVDGASRSVALSALITPVVRGAMKRAPLHVFCGPVAGTGKSYLADLVAAIITGRECPTLSAADRQEELEKRLAGSVLSGQPVISLDNMNGELGGSFLCQLLTQDRLEIRPLGQTGNLNVENHATVLANGNNITIAGDLVRRSIQCSLDPQMERPELREFRGDPFKMIVADRGKYVAAVLTLVRAHLFAHRPLKVKPFASFEDWSRLVRAALLWLGCDDPVETMDQLRVEDPHATQLSNFLTTWKEAIQGVGRGSVPSRPMTARELCATNVHDFDRALIEASGGHESDVNASYIKVGKFLKKHKDRICDGLKICGQMDKHDKIMTWWLAHADGRKITQNGSESSARGTGVGANRPGY